MEPLRNIYLSARFFKICGGIILWFCVAFFVPFIFVTGTILLATFIVLAIADFIFLFSSRDLLTAMRYTGGMWSMGDPNPVEIRISNLSKRQWKLEVIDELPFEFQIRNFSRSLVLKPLEKHTLHYKLTPLSRGLYEYGDLHLMVSSRLNLVSRRQTIKATQSVKVYPSFIQMKQYELYSVSKIARLHGIKKMRRIGLSYEFEQIKSYVTGDDIRQINWKATGRHQQLMTNQFEDEKSQPIYSIIDKSRVMLMPFNGMSLMDYAINTSLSISNIALRKHDKAGLLTFSDKIGSVIKADRKHGQLRDITEALYNQKERNLEANYELLYQSVKRMISTRSLIFLYSNFESIYGLRRVLPVLQKINQQHLLIVVFFENIELDTITQQKARDLKGVYTTILAEQAVNDKFAIAHELQSAGIQTLLSRPEQLSITTINKYLEIKSRGLL